MPDVNVMVTRLRSHVQISDATTLPTADIVECINATQERMWQAGSEWRSLEGLFAFTYDADDDGVQLPSGLERIVAVWQIDSSQSDPTLRRSQVPQTNRIAVVDSANQGKPSETFAVPAPSETFFYLWAGKIYLYPQPSSPTSFEVDYQGAPNDLDVAPGGATVGVNAESHFTRHYYRTLYYGALAALWLFLGSEDRAAIAELEFQKRFERAKAVETTAGLMGGKRVRG